MRRILVPLCVDTAKLAASWCYSEVTSGPHPLWCGFPSGYCFHPVCGDSWVPQLYLHSLGRKWNSNFLEILSTKLFSLKDGEPIGYYSWRKNSVGETIPLKGEGNRGKRGKGAWNAGCCSELARGRLCQDALLLFPQGKWRGGFPLWLGLSLQTGLLHVLPQSLWFFKWCLPEGLTEWLAHIILLIGGLKLNAIRNLLKSGAPGQSKCPCSLLSGNHLFLGIKHTESLCDV